MAMVLSVLALASVAAGPAAAQLSDIPISKCPVTISQPGRYIVTADLVLRSPGSGIVITASGVWINFQGHTLSGSVESGGWAGILVQGASRVTITGARIQGLFFGIRVEGQGGSNIITACTVGSNIYGIGLFNAIGTTIVGNTAEQNVVGIRLFASRGNKVVRNALSDNQAGIGLSDQSNNNSITDNEALSNTEFDLWADSSSGQNGWARNNFRTDNERDLSAGPRFGYIR
jgi:parallel beta-helix repeat protein